MAETCGNLARGAARTDHHVIGDLRFSVQINGDGIFRLVTFQGFQNALQQLLAGNIHRRARSGNARHGLLCGHIG